MDNKEFRAYVMEQRRIGLDNGQIARKLGMDPYIFEDACKYAFQEAMNENAAEIKTVEPLPEIEPREEKVEGIYYVPQNGDDENMAPPPVKKTRKKATKTEETTKAE